MEVVKRSEYCGVEKTDKVLRLSAIPQSTIFRASIGGKACPLHVWVKSQRGYAVCLGEADINAKVGGHNASGLDAVVRHYEPLNATLVIEDE